MNGTLSGAGIRVLLVSATIAFALPAAAQQASALKGDPAAGKKLADRDCVMCHQKKFGEASAVYTRADRKVRTPDQLLAQVRFCNVELKTNYFPEEEEHVAAYLNAQYYRFKP